jgi:hypothetical protein
VTGRVYAPLEPELVEAVFGVGRDGAEAARRLSYAQRHAVRWAYEAWQEFDEKPRPGPQRPLVAWGEVEDGTGTRWPLDDPRFMPSERVGSGRTYPVPRCGLTGRPGGGKVYSFVTGTTPCGRRAGERTNHYGAGPCWRHRGNTRAGNLRGAYVLAHAFARELDCDPWEGLLRAVRIAAGKVGYSEWVLSQAQSDLELEGRVVRPEGSEGGRAGLLVHPDTGEPLGVGEFRDRSFWVAQSTLWVDRLARYSKMAVDAGVAERLVQAVEVEGQQLGRVLTAALDALEGQVSEDVLGEVRARMRRELLQIEAESSDSRVRASRDADSGVVDSTYVGEIVPDRVEKIQREDE